MKDKKGVLGLNLVGSVIITLLIIAVLCIAMFLSLSSIIPTISTVDVATTPKAGVAEYLLTVNGTGYALQTCSAFQGGTLTSITAINETAQTTELSSGNYTLSGCTVTATAGSIVKNNRWNITAYTFNYKSASQDALGLQNNITTGTTNFIKNVPTIMVILGVVVLILAVAIIIVAVRRFGNWGGEGGESKEVGYAL